MGAVRSTGPVTYPIGQEHDCALIARETSPAGAARPKLLDRVREAIRTRHYSRRTEKVYVHWIRRFIFFHAKRHPMEMGAAEVSAFLTPGGSGPGSGCSWRPGSTSTARRGSAGVTTFTSPWFSEPSRTRSARPA